MTAVVSVGVAGALGPEAVAAVAAAAERAGLSGLWVNDTPGGDSLAALHAAASATTRLRLATGVIPVDRRDVSDIAAAAAGLPQDRLVLGIGSGQLREGVVDRTRQAARALRERTGARVMVGALGPRMRRMAAADSDGVVLNWLTPAVAAAQTARARTVSAAARTALYVRSAFDVAARPRLEEESARYAGFPAYAANFRRLRMPVSETVLAPDTAAELLPVYRAAVDEVVLRAITPTDDLAGHLRFIEQAAALLSEP